MIQANEANELDYYKNTIVATMSTTTLQDGMVQIQVEPSKLNGLSRSGIVKCDQILTISRTRLIRLIGLLEPRYMERIDQALRDVLSLS